MFLQNKDINSITLRYFLTSTPIIVKLN